MVTAWSRAFRCSCGLSADLSDLTSAGPLLTMNCGGCPRAESPASGTPLESRTCLRGAEGSGSPLWGRLSLVLFARRVRLPDSGFGACVSRNAPCGHTPGRWSLLAPPAPSGGASILRVPAHRPSTGWSGPAGEASTATPGRFSEASELGPGQGLAESLMAVGDRGTAWSVQGPLGLRRVMVRVEEHLALVKTRPLLLMSPIRPHWCSFPGSMQPEHDVDSP